MPSGGSEEGARPASVAAAGEVEEHLRLLRAGVAESAAAEYAELAAVLETRMANESSVSTTVELPQLAWHERPNWPNKL